MSDKKINSKKLGKNNKCKIKCKNCQFYDREDDYCMEKDIEFCTKQTNINFSKCEDYLVRDSLVMF